MHPVIYWRPSWVVKKFQFADLLLNENISATWEWVKTYCWSVGDLRTEIFSQPSNANNIYPIPHKVRFQLVEIGASFVFCLIAQYLFHNFLKWLKSFLAEFHFYPGVSKVQLECGGSFKSRQVTRMAITGGNIAFFIQNITQTLMRTCNLFVFYICGITP